MRECSVADTEADVIRLSVPADDALRPVIEVAVGVLARRWGLSEDEVCGVRDATTDAFSEIVAAGAPGVVELVLEARPGHVDVHLAQGDVERSIEAPGA
jgi:hypothetical protein